MRLEGPATRLTIFIGEADQHHRRPLYTEIIHRALQSGIAGATVLRGIEGFGASTVVHTSRLMSMSTDLPVAVILVDDPARIEAFLPELDELISEGLVIQDEVHVVKYVGQPQERRG